jgi:integrase
MHVSDQLKAKSRAFVRLLVLTGSREAQAARITAGDVDRAAGLWRLPAGEGSKNYLERVVPLGTLALEALARVWPSEDVDADFGILGGVAGGSFQGFSRLKRRVDELVAQRRARIAAETGAPAQPMPAWRWHDLRRSVRSGLAAMGVPREVAELAIGHISGRSQLERTYDVHTYDEETRAALLRWQQHCEGLLKGNDSNVVPLKRPA